MDENENDRTIEKAYASAYDSIYDEDEETDPEMYANAYAEGEAYADESYEKMEKFDEEDFENNPYANERDFESMNADEEENEFSNVENGFEDGKNEFDEENEFNDVEENEFNDVEENEFNDVEENEFNDVEENEFNDVEENEFNDDEENEFDVAEENESGNDEDEPYVGVYSEEFSDDENLPEYMTHEKEDFGDCEEDFEEDECGSEENFAEEEFPDDDESFDIGPESDPDAPFVTLVADKVYPSDEYGKGVVMLSEEMMDSLDVSAGDPVEIAGERKTVAKVWKANILDSLNSDALRIDVFIRTNAGVSPGDAVTVRKTRSVAAERISLAPLEGENIPIDKNMEELIRYNITDRFVVKGDIVPVRHDLFAVNERRPMMRFSNVPEVKKQNAEFVVTQAIPRGKPLYITDETVVVFEKKPAGIHKRGVSFDDIGALDSQLRDIRDAIEIPIRHPEIFRKLCIEPPKGLILHGIPGTGKTMIARAVANEIGANFYYVAGPELVKGGYGGSEEEIRKLFETAASAAPSVIFIDEIDSIAPKREESQDVERRMVAQLLTMMDGMLDTSRVFVVGATNRLNAIDPALRRPGRFDREIEIGAPDLKGREEILRIHAAMMPLEGKPEIIALEKEIRKAVSENASETVVESLKAELSEKKSEYKNRENELFSSLACRTQGFVGADLAALCREAALNTVRRSASVLDSDEPVSPEILETLAVTFDDFEAALRICEPSALREIAVEIPDVSWNDVAGLDDVCREIVETIEWPLKYPEKFKHFGIEPPCGILLYGPPGTGKTLLAQAVAHESDAGFISVKSAELLMKWVGDSEKAIKEIFRKARQTSPSIIFFDEIDAFATIRDSGNTGTRSVAESALNQMLVEMDGIDRLKDVFIIAATNRPDEIDPALLRPGRLDRIVYVGAPDEAGRKAIFELYLENVPIKDDVDIDELAAGTEGCTGADIESICREAVMFALREDFDTEEVGMDSFRKALEKVPPTVTKYMAERYEKISEHFSNRAKPVEENDPYLAYR